MKKVASLLMRPILSDLSSSHTACEGRLFFLNVAATELIHYRVHVRRPNGRCVIRQTTYRKTISLLQWLSLPR